MSYQANVNSESCLSPSAGPLSVMQTCRRLGVSRFVVLSLIARGVLDADLVLGRWAISAESLERFVREDANTINRTNSAKVAQRAESLRATISELRAAGASSWRDLADGLNSRGISAPRGGRWFPASVGRLLRAMQNSEPARDNAA